jgi:16S rRNA (guanine1207-N2)-methyltransferase
VALFGAPAGMPLGSLDAKRCEVIQPVQPDHDRWAERGLPVRTDIDGPYAATIITLPRSRALAQDRIARAESATPGGLVVIDGAKTDGVEAIVKALRGRVALQGPVSKAHGKVAWFEAGAALEDWIAPDHHRNPEGDIVAAGVFSADGADPGSRMLADALPERIAGRVADFGAGWGWLAREILKRDPDELHLVEADARALSCARKNLSDPRVRFHWADATGWTAGAPLDAVVMNPPFHAGREADPAIGRGFIAAAARLLGGRGQLWLVANRHLPYEQALKEAFRETGEVTGDTRFKILYAARPRRPERG